MVVDTDTLVRFITRDDEEKAQKVRLFFHNHKDLVLTDLTFAECFWVLKSFYNYKKDRLIEIFRMLIDAQSFRCNSSLLSLALDILETHNTSFIDAYTAAYAQTKNDGKVISFDKGYDKVKGVTRIEP
jgi:predicted nucleic acid-binding protein